jgi:hypothetical protein
MSVIYSQSIDSLNSWSVYEPKTNSFLPVKKTSPGHVFLLKNIYSIAGGDYRKDYYTLSLLDYNKVVEHKEGELFKTGRDEDFERTMNQMLQRAREISKAIS